MKYVDAVTTAEKISDKFNITMAELVDVFADIPAADVQPVRHGRWLPSDDYITTAYGTIHCQICSECGANLMEDSDYDYDFCPVCGARMDGDIE